MKLVREGDVFTGYAKNQEADEWKLIGSAEIPMAADVLIGFAVDSNKVANEIDNLSTARFSHISMGAGGTYVVKNGDYLLKIARENGCTVEQLKAANPNIKDINFIRAGWVLNLPGAN